MCLMLFSFNQHPEYRLVLLANRDEFYRRPTAAVHFWPDAPHVAAGRDLERRGTWLGITTDGRWAGLTNYRDPSVRIENGPSRGALVADFLLSDTAADAYLEQLALRDASINGYNLVAGDAEGLFYHSNRRAGVTALVPGIYGLSNHLLDTPWPKVRKGTARLRQLLERERKPTLEAFFALLRDAAPFPDDALPDTGVGLKWERLLSPLFIVSPDYGTRSSTVVLIHREGRVTIAERTYDGLAQDERHPETRRVDFVLRC